MLDNGPTSDLRSLAAIESNLHQAGEAFADASTRLQEAERDRNRALEAINKHQVEFDEAIARLRQQSTPGSKWRLEIERNDPTGVVQSVPEGGDETVLNGASLRAVSAEFMRLKEHVQKQETGPTLRIQI
ncbi:hypothetical protein [Novosphingobium album (ex Hu et al. 2023)]|uniref:Uncharacterized protein n=1 Tax=Novosphingobium album (ex Hu et al. 2023) TaxID=2930093 RepID=A0ABT0B430_9SPHN|nr:hypothetical protein [Novosphingobium album (ex Hu et al. 2023)]MCJ2179811.1 hypothetical protein [Novosphingobium album (ex Hu et al. 2023)]